MLLPQPRPMWLSRWGPARDRQGRQRPRRRLAVHSLEFLEDRTVPSTLTRRSSLKDIPATPGFSSAMPSKPPTPTQAQPRIPSLSVPAPTR